MRYLYKIICLSLFLTTIHLSAQTQSNYTLKSNQVSIFEKNKTLTSSLIKVGNTLKWLQKEQGTSHTIEYTITNITGNWDASTSRGHLTYSLSKSGFTTVTFSLIGTENDGIEAILSVQEGENPALAYTFNITNITYP